MPSSYRCTSAYRGRAKFAGFSPTKAQRMLLESIAREAGPKEFMRLIAIDAAIDLE